VPTLLIHDKGNFCVERVIQFRFSIMEDEILLLRRGFVTVQEKNGGKS
jgi:hypothetical protein